MRRSFDKASSKSVIHKVSAWATANHISLGQVVGDDKANEIPAFPKVLAHKSNTVLQISGAVVTSDALGCQTDIAQQILNHQADDCRAVPGNQPTLHRGIAAFFVDHLEDEFARTKVRRRETRESRHARRFRKASAAFARDMPTPTSASCGGRR